MTRTAGRVAALRRFPVKGFSPEDLSAVELETGRQIAGDRAFAIENGPSGFDPTAPKKLPKFKFLCLMRNARLAGLRTRYDETTGRFEIRQGGEVVIDADLGTDDGRAGVEAWLAAFMGEELKGPLKLLPAPGAHTFSDTSLGVVSIINRSSVSAIEDMVGSGVDPLRFRGNIDIDGFEPWTELEWVGRRLAIGPVELRVVQRTVRCAAVNVDPTTAERDMAIPNALLSRLGHADCGVYAEVITAGRVALGDEIRLR